LQNGNVADNFMKNILLIFGGAFFLISCSNQQVEKTQVENKTIVQNKDTATKDTSLKSAYEFFNNPFRDNNNFNIRFGDRFIDSLHALYSNQKQIKVTFTKDICIGDNCESYKTMLNKQDHTVLYFFKGDGGEYGFSNDQFYLKNDTLIYARNFVVSIKTWPTDSTNTEWKIKEIVYNFQAEKPYSRTRTALTRELDRFDFTLGTVTPKSDNAINFEKAYQEELTELKKLLEMKESVED
jgi:hypothetical protein